jgi:preprotein translocase subunit SecA
MTPSADYRLTRLAPAKPLHRGIDARLHALIGRAKRRSSLGRQLQAEGEKIHALAAELREKSEAHLSADLAHFRSRFQRAGSIDADFTNQALAAVAETARRKLGLAPYPVQLMAALAVQRGFLIEMATGEGKTLTVALAAALAGWAGQPCHVLTANDYLAARDAAWLAPFYAACGLASGWVGSEMKPCKRRENYARAVVYTTSKEAVADFLRDRLQLGPLAQSTRRMIRTLLRPGSDPREGLVQRGLHTAIVDEADSALIDEAVTPLIISRKQENLVLQEACARAYRIAASLESGIDYTVDEKFQDLELKPAGLARIRSGREELPGIWRGEQRALELVKQALRARELFHLGKQYVVENGEIVIVDEFTGRLMHQRTWREGLHQAVEAKEGLQVSAPAETLARLSFQRFFRFYQKLSGLSGTVSEAAPEIWHIYRLPIVRIPTHRPCMRIELPDRIFSTAAQKWDAIVEEIGRRHATRQPLLVGTRSVQASEMLGARLVAKGLAFELLNATRHREEANIIAGAGEQARITIATNMAGRGTDIKLGPLVPEIGGLHVILTERHDSRRIDRQLMGRAARQGDPGSAQAFVSLEDELPVRHAPGWLRLQVRAALAARAPGAAKLAGRLVDRAQRHAERAAFKQRRAVLEMDRWVEDSLAFAGAELPAG